MRNGKCSDDGRVPGKPYDLAERTAIFGEAVIDFLKKVPMKPITRRLIDQLSGAGTSVGAKSLWQEAKELHLIFCKIYRGGKDA